MHSFIATAVHSLQIHIQPKEASHQIKTHIEQNRQNKSPCDDEIMTNCSKKKKKNPVFSPLGHMTKRQVVLVD